MILPSLGSNGTCMGLRHCSAQRAVVPGMFTREELQTNKKASLKHFQC